MLILASASPRRRELLAKITKDFKVVPSGVDEGGLDLPPEELPAALSRRKALEIRSRYPDDDILSCDTIVVLDGQVFGKPRDEEDAKRMLRALSGRTHLVVSGYTFLGQDFEVTRTVESRVHFNELSERTIDDYVKSGSPLDKAGAYGVQDREFGLVKKVEGSVDNVIGLPVEDIRENVFSRRAIRKASRRLP